MEPLTFGSVCSGIEAASCAWSELGMRHACVDHVREYVRGSVHTNGLENFWSLFKRAIKGTWTHIAPFQIAAAASR